jgi:hypothetical protein
MVGFELAMRAIKVSAELDRDQRAVASSSPAPRSTPSSGGRR